MVVLKLLENSQCVEKISLSRPATRIGRAADNDVVITDRAVSGYHAVVEMIKNNTDNNPHYVVKDLQSTNKTYVNGKQISTYELRDHDVVRIGLSYFEFDSNAEIADSSQFQKTTKLHKSWIPGVFYTKDD